MTFREFRERFLQLGFLPKSEEYRTLLLAEVLEDADRMTLLNKLSALNDEFAKLTTEQAAMLDQVETFLRQAKKEFRKVNHAIREDQERVTKLQAFESRLQNI